MKPSIWTFVVGIFVLTGCAAPDTEAPISVVPQSSESEPSPVAVAIPELASPPETNVSGSEKATGLGETRRRAIFRELVVAEDGGKADAKKTFPDVESMAYDEESYVLEEKY